MILPVLLVFCSTSLMIFGLALLFLRPPSRSVERLMTARAAAALAQVNPGEESLQLFKDQAHSGFGPLQKLLGAEAAVRLVLEQLERLLARIDLGQGRGGPRRHQPLHGAAGGAEEQKRQAEDHQRRGAEHQQDRKDHSLSPVLVAVLGK